MKLMEQRRQDKKEIDPIIQAMHCTRLGQNQQAIALLRDAYRQHSDGLQFLKAEPIYDPLRNDSRFEQLIAQLRFLTSCVAKVVVRREDFKNRSRLAASF